MEGVCVGWRPPPHLAADDGHEKVVEHEALSAAGTVEAEEEDGEAEGHALLGGAAECSAQELHPCHGQQQGTAAVGAGGGEMGARTPKPPLQSPNPSNWTPSQTLIPPPP